MRHHFRDPGRGALRTIAQAHLGDLPPAQLTAMLNAFEGKQADGLVATDQLLNALHLLAKDGPATGLSSARRKQLRETLLEALSRTGTA